MRLSTAILLGDSLKKCSPWNFSCELGGCGCAIAGAMLAAGIATGERRSTLANLKMAWAWVTNQHIDDISHMYFGLADGLYTIEQIADYVRSVEPEEAEAVRVESPRNENEVSGQATPVTELASATAENKRS